MIKIAITEDENDGQWNTRVWVINGEDRDITITYEKFYLVDSTGFETRICFYRYDPNKEPESSPLVLKQDKTAEFTIPMPKIIDQIKEFGMQAGVITALAEVMIDGQLHHSENKIIMNLI